MKLPVVEAVQDRVDVPEPPRMLVDDRVQARPVVGLTESDNVTVPANPLSGDSAIVEVAGEFTVEDTLAGLAATVKSGAGVTVNDTVAV